MKRRKLNLTKQKLNTCNLQFKTTTKKLKLEGEVLTKIKEMKYLGVILDTQLKPKKHLDAKQKSTSNAFNSLRKVGITCRYTNYDVKSFLYKVYCRPILHYGVENLTLSLKGRVK